MIHAIHIERYEQPTELCEMFQQMNKPGKVNRVTCNISDIDGSAGTMSFREFITSYEKNHVQQVSIRKTVIATPRGTAWRVSFSKEDRHGNHLISVS